MITLDPPRWTGGPMICKTMNLPAHPDKAAMVRFLESICMLGNLETFSVCPHCNHLHHHCRPPSSGSSGDMLHKRR